MAMLLGEREVFLRKIKEMSTNDLEKNIAMEIYNEEKINLINYELKTRKEEENRIRLEKNLKIAEDNVNNTKNLVEATEKQVGQNKNLVRFTRLLAIATFILAITTVAAPFIVNYYTNKWKIEDERNDALICLHREISENRFLLEDQLSRTATTKTKLQTVAWDTKKHLINFDKKYLLESISLIYDDIRIYNQTCDFIASLRAVGEMRLPEKRKLFNEQLNIIAKRFGNKLRSLELLTFQELVKEGLVTPDEWDEETGGKWDREVSIPRIKIEFQSIKTNDSDKQ